MFIQLKKEKTKQWIAMNILQNRIWYKDINPQEMFFKLMQMSNEQYLVFI